ncbi:MAG: hypothetical protein QXP94_00210 [Thermofilaceae archaeon]
MEKGSGGRLLEDYCHLEAKGEKLYIGACGHRFSTLPGCTEELKVSLSSIAEALEAFMLAGLVPGGVAEGLRSRDS